MTSRAHANGPAGVTVSPRACAYALEGHETVEGWLGVGAIGTLLLLNRYQHNHGERGSVCEIGVHHGRLFILLALLRQTGEIAVAVDLFEKQYLNVDFSGSGNRTKFWNNIDRWIGSRTDIETLSVDSLTLSPEELLILADDQTVRLFSVDGGHTSRHLLSDVALAARVLTPHGVVIVDDFYNPDWPGVNEGVFRYLQNAPRLAPFCYGDNKLYLCAMDQHAAMLDWTRSVLVPLSHYAKEVELCGVRAIRCNPPTAKEILMGGITVAT